MLRHILILIVSAVLSGGITVSGQPLKLPEGYVSEAAGQGRYGLLNGSPDYDQAEAAGSLISQQIGGFISTIADFVEAGKDFVVRFDLLDGLLVMPADEAESDMNGAPDQVVSDLFDIIASGLSGFEYDLGAVSEILGKTAPAESFEEKETEGANEASAETAEYSGTEQKSSEAGSENADGSGDEKSPESVEEAPLATEAADENEDGGDSIKDEDAGSKDALPKTVIEDAGTEEPSASSSEASGKEQEEDVEYTLELPEAGDEICGFFVTDITDMDFIGTKLLTLIHEKSGAEVKYYANDAENLAFDISVRTPSSYTSIIPAAVELCLFGGGSVKYPKAGILEYLDEHTDSTYLNTIDTGLTTEFPAASYSEDQLYIISDCYLDSIFNPLCFDNNYVFDDVVYRYVIDGETGQPYAAGLIYDHYSMTETPPYGHAVNHALGLLYPGSYASVLDLELSEDIFSITIDDLRAYYRRYYHPSNMLFSLYGKLDLNRFLENIDSYIGGYDAKYIDISDKDYYEWRGYREAVISYPAAEETQADGNCFISYAFELPQLSDGELYRIEMLAEWMGSKWSPLYEECAEKFPDAQLYASVIKNGKATMLFQLQYADEGHKDEFISTVKECLAGMAEEFSGNEFLSTVADEELYGLERDIEDQNNIYTVIIENINSALTGEAVPYPVRYNTYKNFGDELSEGKAEKLIKAYMTDPAASVCVVSVPEAGLYERNETMREQWVEDIFENMSLSQISAVIEENEGYERWLVIQENIFLGENISSNSAR